MTQNFKNLNVYQEAYDLSKDIYNDLKDIDKHFWLRDRPHFLLKRIILN